MKYEIVLITGASSGIGYKTAVLAAERGHKVIATAPTESLLKDLPESAALKLIIDICDEASIAKALADATEQVGEITCLINNAGYAQPGPVELVDTERLRKQFEVNVFGTMSMTRAIMPYFRKQGGGKIITLSSMLGLVSLPFQGVYAASKHALEALHDALRIEVKSANVSVVLIEPGFIKTAFLKTATALTPDEWLEEGPYARELREYFKISTAAESDKPTGVSKTAAALAGTPEQVAAMVVKALEASQPKVRYPVTAMARVFPFLRRVLPISWWDKMQAGQMTVKAK